MTVHQRSSTTFLYGLLFFELGLSAFLMIPFFDKQKTKLVAWMERMPYSGTVRWFISAAMMLLVASFIGNVYNVQRYKERYSSSEETLNEARILTVEMERNLSGCALVIAVFMHRYFMLLKSHNRIRVNHEVLEKQARNQANQALNGLMDEKNKLDKDGKAKTTGKQDKSDPVSPKSDKTAGQDKDVQEKLAKAEKRAKEAEMELEALKKQAATQQETLNRQADEISNLKGKIQDYELMGIGGKAKAS
jgi:hypothetical protein